MVWVPCSNALASVVNSPCLLKKKILRLCYCMAACQISSFVFEACGVASAWGVLGVFESTLQLWLRALMSKAIPWIRSRSCSRTAAGVGPESGPESACNASGADVWVAAVARSVWCRNAVVTRSPPTYTTCAGDPLKFSMDSVTLWLTMTMTHSEQSNQRQSAAWPWRRE